MFWKSEISLVRIIWADAKLIPKIAIYRIIEEIVYHLIIRFDILTYS